MPKLIFKCSGRILEEIDCSISVSGRDGAFNFCYGYDGSLEAEEPESKHYEYTDTLRNGDPIQCLYTGCSPLTLDEAKELAQHMIEVWTEVRDTIKEITE